MSTIVPILTDSHNGCLYVAVTSISAFDKLMVMYYNDCVSKFLFPRRLYSIMAVLNVTIFRTAFYNFSNNNSHFQNSYPIKSFLKWMCLTMAISHSDRAPEGSFQQWSRRVPYSNGRDPQYLIFPIPIMVAVPKKYCLSYKPFPNWPFRKWSLWYWWHSNYCIFQIIINNHYNTIIICYSPPLSNDIHCESACAVLNVHFLHVLAA